MSRAMHLNVRQERFAQNLVAMSLNATAAYRAAGYRAKTDAAARAGASEILANPNVKARVAELQERAAKKVEKTVADVIADLDRLRDQAFATGQLSAGVAAVMGAARVLGMITDKARVEQVLHKPALLPTERIELTESEWRQQFDPNWKPDIN